MPPRNVKHQILRRSMALLAVASLLWTVFLLGSHVHAPVAEQGRDDCGASALSINAEGSSIGGGEPRVDQATFDRVCVDRARARIRHSLLPAGIFVLAVVGILTGGVPRTRRLAREHDASSSVRTD